MLLLVLFSALFANPYGIPGTFNVNFSISFSGTHRTGVYFLKTKKLKLAPNYSTDSVYFN